MGGIPRLRLPVVVAVLCLVVVATLLIVQQSDRSWKENYIVQLARNYSFFRAREDNCEGRMRQAKEGVQRRKNRGLIIDTIGCKIPKFDPFDPSIRDLYEEKGEYPCPGPPLFLSSQPDGSIAINETVLIVHHKVTPDKVTCTYQGIKRRYEKPGNVRENDYDLKKPRKLRFGIPLHEDYVIVECVLGEEKFQHYFPLVRLKKSIEKVKTTLLPPNPRLNVIVVGVDSISKLNFLRHFRKTKMFMEDKKAFYDMKGYTKVGDNTFPNLTPLLTGRFPGDIWNDTLKDTMYFDDVDFVWRRYAQKGFRTFYAEDSPQFGTYNYGRRGFNVTPTDYYLRPLYLAMHSSELRKKGPWYCFNSMIETDVIYNYLKDFTTGMGGRPYFAFAMVSALTHDYLNYAGHADPPTVRLLDTLWETGALNDSLLVMFGDHGLRFGSIRSTHIGKYEERMPFLYLRFPPWFLQQYPAMQRHLAANRDRLVTLFDVHATLLHLLDVEGPPADDTPYGGSLLREVSTYRTCETAHIYPHWCVCHVFCPLSPDEPVVVKAVEAILHHVNALLQNTTCSPLNLSKVYSAKSGQMNDLVARFIRHEGVVVDRNVVYGERSIRFEDVWVTFGAGKGLFEGTVRRDVVEDKYRTVDVFRIDAHPEHFVCTADPELVPLCECDS